MTSDIDLDDVPAANRRVKRTDNADIGNITDSPAATEELRQFVERIERLEEEKTGVSDDIKEVFAELKGRGFDVKTIRQILRIRKQDQSERQEQEAILELYMQALGMA